MLQHFSLLFYNKEENNSFENDCQYPQHRFTTDILKGVRKYFCGGVIDVFPFFVNVDEHNVEIVIFINLKYFA